MSDSSQGPGWWLASDGKWYPPEAATPTTAMPAPGPPPAPGSRPWWRKWWVITLGVLLLIGLLGSLAGDPEEAADEVATDQTSTTEAESTTTEAAAAAPTTAAPATTAAPTTTASKFESFGSGKKEVGRDISPGLYRTRKASTGCYWARLKGMGGGFEDIHANDNTNGPAVVEILSTDAGFESSGCATWTKDVSAITANRTEFGEGTFIVGTDMEPGTYRNTGDGACYWARLRSFAGGMDAIVANDNTEGTTIVTIDPGDVGFTSSGCGSWKKS